MSSLWAEGRKILLLAGIFFIILIMMDFNTRVGEMFRLSEEKERIETTATMLVQTQIALITKIAYATSEPAVSEWARENHMSREGDQVIIPLMPPGVTPTPEVIIEPTPAPMSNWEVWMMLFFNK
jgi:hypothetical protein